MRTVYLKHQPQAVQARACHPQLPESILQIFCCSDRLSKQVQQQEISDSQISALAAAIRDYGFRPEIVEILISILQTASFRSSRAQAELAVQQLVQTKQQLGANALPLCQELSQRGLLTQQMYEAALQEANSDVQENLAFFPFLIEENRKFADFEYSLGIVVRACVAGAMSRFCPDNLTKYILALARTFDANFGRLEDALLGAGAVHGLASLVGASLSQQAFDNLCELLCVLLEHSNRHRQLVVDNIQLFLQWDAALERLVCPSEALLKLVELVGGAT